MGQFYVYAFYRGETVVYVGKGSGRRLHNQERRFGSKGVILKEFKSEKAAYNYEASLIQEMKPELNRAAGGGGAITRRKAKLPAWYITEQAQIEKLGSRKYTALKLLALGVGRIIEASKLEDIRRVAYGSGI